MAAFAFWQKAQAIWQACKHSLSHTVKIGQFANVAVYVQLMTPSATRDETMLVAEIGREGESGSETELKKQSGNRTMTPAHKLCNITMHNWACGRGKVYEQ